MRTLARERFLPWLLKPQTLRRRLSCSCVSKLEMDANNFACSNFAIINIPPPPDAELTNLNWVAGAPVPMQNPVSPTRKGSALRGRYAQREEARVNSSTTKSAAKQSCSAQTPLLPNAVYSQQSNATNCSTESAATQTLKREVLRKEKTKDEKGSKSDRADGEEAKDKKPNCSYTSLIGLALMASEGGCLPVSEIYTYIEDEFPYFRNAPDGWKNSIRHNLSLNPAFRKVKDSMNWQGKKGFYWEVTPERRSSVEREVERYLRQEGKLRDMERRDGAVPFPSCLHASIPTMPQAPNIIARPICQFQFCHGTQPYYNIMSAMHRHYPPPPSFLPPPLPPSPARNKTHTTITTGNIVIPPTTTATVTLLDMDMSPGQFAGFSDPSSSTANSALHDLFGLQLSSPNSLVLTGSHCNSHVYTQPSTRTQVVESYGCLSSQFVTPGVCAVKDRPRTDCRTARLRKQALDQLVIPEEQSISTSQTDTAISECSAYTSTHFLQNSDLLDHCMTLEECFTASGGEDTNSSSGLDYCGELPLPPSAHAWMGREEERTGMYVKMERENLLHSSKATTKEVADVTIPNTCTSPMELSSAVSTHSESGGGREQKVGKRKRVSSAHRPIRANKSNDCDVKEAKKVMKGGEEDTGDNEAGQNMLSCVLSDCEQTVRDSLLSSVVHGTCTLLAAPGECMVEDGLYSPPSGIHQSCDEVY